MAALPVLGQALGATLVLVGLFLLLPFAVALTSVGALVFIGSMLAEVLTYRPAAKPKAKSAEVPVQRVRAA